MIAYFDTSAVVPLLVDDEQALRGCDAVHCAAGLALAGPETVALTGDRDLLAAWRAHDLDVIDTRA